MLSVIPSFEDCVCECVCGRWRLEGVCRDLIYHHCYITKQSNKSHFNIHTALYCVMVSFYTSAEIDLISNSSYDSLVSNKSVCQLRTSIIYIKLKSPDLTKSYLGLYALHFSFHSVINTFDGCLTIKTTIFLKQRSLE